MSVSWEYSADPPVGSAAWQCKRCDSFDKHSALDMPDVTERREHIECGAREHVMITGHPVEVAVGQWQLYVPLATTPLVDPDPDGPARLTDHEQRQWDDIESRLQ